VQLSSSRGARRGGKRRKTGECKGQRTREREGGVLRGRPIGSTITTVVPLYIYVKRTRGRLRRVGKKWVGVTGESLKGFRGEKQLVAK